MDSPNRNRRRLTRQQSLDDPELMIPSPPGPSRAVSPEYRPKRSERVGSMVSMSKIMHSMSSLSVGEQDMDAVGWEDTSPRGGQEARRTQTGSFRRPSQPSGSPSERIPRTQSSQMTVGSRGTSIYGSSDSRKSTRRRREDDLLEREEPRSQRQRREHEESAARSGSTVQGASGGSGSATCEENVVQGTEGRPQDRRTREQRRVREARQVRKHQERERHERGERGGRGMHGGRDDRPVRSRSVPQGWLDQAAEEKQPSRPPFTGEGHRDPETRQHGGNIFKSRTSQDRE